MKMNKKADIPIIILVIGIVGICILTILSFVKFNIDIDEDFLGIGLIETINPISEEIDFLNENPAFEFDYGNKFRRGNVGIGVKENLIEGNYSIQECSYLFVGCKDKNMVSVIYQN